MRFEIMERRKMWDFSLFCGKLAVGVLHIDTDIADISLSGDLLAFVSGITLINKPEI